MKKKFSLVKLYIKAGKANPSPPIGPILGQKGINILNFCKQFNERTKDKCSLIPLTVIINIKKNKSFSLLIKEPPVSKLILKYSSTPKGSQKPGRDFVGKIDKENISKISKIKSKEMIHSSNEVIKKMVIGTIKSMGIKII